jgi:hypothetical protein
MASAMLAATNCWADAVMDKAAAHSRMAALRMDFRSDSPQNDLPQALMYIRRANGLPLRLKPIYV